MNGSISIIQLPCQFPCSELQYHSENLVAPVRTDSADLDGDGILDLIISDIGILYPSNEKAGKVVVIYSSSLSNLSNNSEQIIIDQVGRVACSEAADLDGDSDLDLTLCEFGHTHGSVGWIENVGNYNWNWHVLENKSGSIDAIPFDLDQDGDMDIISVISQLSEEIIVFWNDGSGVFDSEILYKANNTFFGMSGLNLFDIEGDGDMDILFTNGDMMDFDFPKDENFWDYHGLSLLKNDGQGKFQYERLMKFSGAYDSALYDIDDDGIKEIVVVGFRPLMDGLVDYGSHSNLAWLDWDDNSWNAVFPLNDIDGPMISLETVDVDGDGMDELIAANHDIFSVGNISRLISIDALKLTVCQ